MISSFFSVVGIVFRFVEPSIYGESESVGSFEVCVEVAAGELGTDVTVSVDPQVDSDPQTLNGQ